MELLSGYKTYITASVAIVGAIAFALSGTELSTEALASIQTTITALLAVFLRSGVNASK